MTTILRATPPDDTIHQLEACPGQKPSHVTSGMDGTFPRGLLVGTATRVSQEGPGLFLNVEVKAAVDFRELEQVMLLTSRTPAPSVGNNG